MSIEFSPGIKSRFEILKPFTHGKRAESDGVESTFGQISNLEREIAEIENHIKLNQEYDEIREVTLQIRSFLNAPSRSREEKITNRYNELFPKIETQLEKPSLDQILDPKFDYNNWQNSRFLYKDIPSLKSKLRKNKENLQTLREKYEEEKSSNPHNGQRQINSTGGYHNP